MKLVKNLIRRIRKEEYQVYPTERPDWYKARQRAAGFALYGAVGIGREDADKKLLKLERIMSFWSSSWYICDRS
ncbi:MAG: hypothetical protein CM15mP127_13760 [Gammaproteobacteria bacterium]|nr:MAG: hypothetical protein CM15mP127_13760 [Gammaproteobacteria bacterium]